MIKKTMSRFFGLISERAAPERATSEHSIAENSAFDPVPLQPQVHVGDAPGPLMHALPLTSHAGEACLTEQEKRMAWELPVRMAEPVEALVPRSTSKARLLVPALEQMRQTQSALMSGHPAVVEDGMAAATVAETSPEVPSTASPTPRMKRRRVARPKPILEPVPQTAAPAQAAVPEPARPKPVRKQKQLPTQVPSAPLQPAQATSNGWQYSVMLQRSEGSALPSIPQLGTIPAASSGAAPALSSDASSISLMFQRLRSHSQKAATPAATPPTTVAKAPGFLNKLWAK
ncbi:MAG: hypothetical protein ABI114_16510 [Rhodanobacter sp.]